MKCISSAFVGRMGARLRTCLMSLGAGPVPGAISEAQTVHHVQAHMWNTVCAACV